MRSRSTNTCGSPGVKSLINFKSFFSNKDDVAAIACFKICTGFVGCNCHSTRPASILAISKTSLIKDVSRSASDTIMLIFAPTLFKAFLIFLSSAGTAGTITSSSFSLISEAKPKTEVKGVRSS